MNEYGINNQSLATVSKSDPVFLSYNRVLPWQWHTEMPTHAYSETFMPLQQLKPLDVDTNPIVGFKKGVTQVWNIPQIMYQLPEPVKQEKKSDKKEAAPSSSKRRRKRR